MAATFNLEALLKNAVGKIVIVWRYRTQPRQSITQFREKVLNGEIPVSHTIGDGDETGSDDLIANPRYITTTIYYRRVHCISENEMTLVDGS